MKRLLAISTAVICSGAALMAQTETFNIERVYKHMTTANGASHARQGVFANGKFYIHNWTNKTVEVWSQEGEKIEEFESKGTGPGITADEAGNILIENTDNAWPTACGQTRDYRIFKGGENDTIGLKITFSGLRETSSGVRSDYFGPIEGDIMSDEGGTLCIMVQQRPVVNIAKIAKGEVVDTRAFWVDTAFVDGNIVCNIGYGEKNLKINWNTYVGNGASYSQVTCFKYGDEYLVNKMNVGLKGFTYDESTLGSHPIETEAYKGTLVYDHTTVYELMTSAGDAMDATNMTGDRLFTLGDRRFVIKNISYKSLMIGANAFAIADDVTGKIMGLWYGYSEGDKDRTGTACASWFNVIPVDDNTAEIYQYFPADGVGKAFISKYIFRMTQTGIDDVSIDDSAAPAEYYNIQGVKITNPQPGQLYIKRQGAKTTKIVF